MPGTADLSNLSHDALVGAVHDLIARGRVATQEVRASAAKTARIAELEQELAALKGGSTPRGRTTAHARAPKPARHTMTMTRRRAARRIQGQYVGCLKNLAGANRARVKATAKANGVAAAVKLADELLTVGTTRSARTRRSAKAATTAPEAGTGG